VSASPALDELERGLLLAIEGIKRLRQSDDWVDQDHSPLKKRAHLDAVRRGDLAGRKVGAQVFVRREELDAYIERHRIVKCVPTESEAEEQEREIAAILNHRGRTRRTA
jgi:hypothetical protein